MKMISQLVKDLKALDFYYQMSDDSRAYNEGKESMSKFREDFASLSEDGITLFEAECLKQFKGAEASLKEKISMLNIDFKTEIEILEVSESEDFNVNKVDMSLHESVQKEINIDKKESFTAEELTENIEVVEVEEVKIDEETDNGMELFKVTENQIQSFKNDYLDILITNLDDFELIEKVEIGVKDLKKIRLKVDARHKELKAPHLAKCNFLDGMKNNIRGIIDPIEAHLKSQNLVIKDLREEEVKRAEAEAQKIIDDRIVVLKDNGIEFKENFYEVGNVSVDLSTISKMTEEQFLKLSEKVKSENERILEIKRLEAERIEKENAEREVERVRLENQRKEQEAEAERLKKESEALKKEIEDSKKQLEAEKLKLQKESEALLAEINKSKIDSQKIKFIQNGVSVEFDPLSASTEKPLIISYQKGLSSGLFYIETLPLDENLLANYLAESKELVLKVDSKEEERLIIEKELEAEKLKASEKIEADRIAAEKKAEEEKKAAEVKAENERLEAERLKKEQIQQIKETLKPDALIIKDYINSLNSVKFKDVSEPIMLKKISFFKASLTDLISDLTEELEDILN